MNDDKHALFSMRFNGEGGVSEDSSDKSAFLWRHIDIVDGDTEAWLIEELGIDPVVSHALVTEDTRPRSLRVGTGVMFIMRGFNFNEGADIDDLVSLRMWVDGDRAVTLRHRRLVAPRDVKAALENGLGPKDAGEFMVAITDALASRMAEGVHNLEARADDVEEEVLLGKPADLRERLADLRRELIGVRRHLGPQRDALTKLFSEELPWLTSENRARLREVINQTTRYVEELDTARERAAITQEEAMSGDVQYTVPGCVLLECRFRAGGTGQHERSIRLQARLIHTRIPQISDRKDFSGGVRQSQKSDRTKLRARRRGAAIGTGSLGLHRGVACSALLEICTTHGQHPRTDRQFIR